MNVATYLLAVGSGSEHDWSSRSARAEATDRTSRPRAGWVSPRKLRQCHIDRVVEDVEEAEKQLYFAAISGEVRVRSQGKLFGPKTLQRMAGTRFDDENRFALPLTSDCRLMMQGESGVSRRFAWIDGEEFVVG
jgi:hypothetical protein